MDNNGFIDSVDINFNNDEKNMILHYVQENFDDQKKIKQIISELEKDNMRESPISEVLYQSGQSNSSRYNQQFKDILADLFVLFGYTDKVSSFLEDEKSLTESFMQNLKKGLNNIEHKINAYEYIANNEEGFTEVKYENFDDKENFQSYTDEMATLFSNPKSEYLFTKQVLCSLNKNNDALTLSKLGEVIPTGLIPEVMEQTGQFLKAKGKSQPLINMVQYDNPDDVWSQTILSDSPFRVPTAGQDHGAVCKFRIVLQKTRHINNISLNPFVNYPVKLIEVNTYENVEDYYKGEDYAKTILSEGFESYYDPFYFEKPKTLEFPAVECQVVEFVINQEHYELEEYTVKEDDKNQIDLIEKDYYKDKKKLMIPEDTDITSTIEMDLNNQNSNLYYFKKLASRFFQKINLDNKNELLKKILNSVEYFMPSLNSNNFTSQGIEDTDSSERLVNINKYQYQYGFEGILPQYKEFSKRGVHVSEPYYFKDNIKEVSLVTDDENFNYFHQGSDIPATSIEYYITNLEEPEPNNSEWYPILPENHEFRDEDGNYIIQGERLLPEEGLNELISTTQFPAEPGTVTIYKNGDKLTDDSKKIGVYDNGYTYTYFVEEDGEEVEKTIEFDGNLVVIESEKANYENNIYTIDYQIPDNIDPTIVNLEEVASPRNFIDDDGRLGEKFENLSQNNSIELTYFPYNNREEFYKSDNEVDHDDSFPENPLEGQYSPNYDSGYMPIRVEGEGKAVFYDHENEETITYEGKIKQDGSGVPYRYMTTEEDADTGEEYSVEVIQENKEPYFYNKTNYLNPESPVFQDYEPEDYPVFEYLHFYRNLYFNDHLLGTKNEVDNFRVYYKYLSECIRVKIIMYNNTQHRNGITPVVRNYAIKTKPFKQMY